MHAVVPSRSPLGRLGSFLTGLFRPAVWRSAVSVEAFWRFLLAQSLGVALTVGAYALHTSPLRPVALGVSWLLFASLPVWLLAWAHLLVRRCHALGWPLWRLWVGPLWFVSVALGLLVLALGVLLTLTDPAQAVFAVMVWIAFFVLAVLHLFGLAAAPFGADLVRVLPALLPLLVVCLGPLLWMLGRPTRTPPRRW